MGGNSISHQTITRRTVFSLPDNLSPSATLTSALNFHDWPLRWGRMATTRWRLAAIAVRAHLLSAPWWPTCRRLQRRSPQHNWDRRTSSSTVVTCKTIIRFVDRWPIPPISVMSTVKSLHRWQQVLEQIKRVPRPEITTTSDGKIWPRVDTVSRIGPFRRRSTAASSTWTTQRPTPPTTQRATFKTSATWVRTNINNVTSVWMWTAIFPFLSPRAWSGNWSRRRRREGRRGRLRPSRPNETVQVSIVQKPNLRPLEKKCETMNECKWVSEWKEERWKIDICMGILLCEQTDIVVDWSRHKLRGRIIF